jgi:hypothetical protein
LPPGAGRARRTAVGPKLIALSVSELDAAETVANPEDPRALPVRPSGRPGWRCPCSECGTCGKKLSGKGDPRRG